MWLEKLYFTLLNSLLPYKVYLSILLNDLKMCFHDQNPSVISPFKYLDMYTLVGFGLFLFSMSLHQENTSVQYIPP